MSAACTIRIYGAMERQKQMSVQQLSVFIENRCGTLLEVTEVLAKEKIDIRALSLTETPEYGILRERHLPCLRCDTRCPKDRIGK